MTKIISTYFNFIQTDESSAKIFDNEILIAEIQNLQLCNVRFQPKGTILIGDKVPMPLFWWQYANHEDPERNTGSNRTLRLVELHHDKVIFSCTSTNQSRSVLSKYTVILAMSKNDTSYVFHIRAKLTIPEGKKWLVTPNAAHGEVEFCNLWIQDSFTTKPKIQKRFQACFVQRQNEVVCLHHHHLETNDKHNCVLMRNQRLLWLLEDVNPVVELISDQTVHAGLCAYMWDAHFGYSICTDGRNKILSGKKEFVAEFRLYSLNRTIGVSVLKSSKHYQNHEIKQIPIYVDGLNSFSKTLDDFTEDEQYNLWPWTFEVEDNSPGNGVGILDRIIGLSDSCSLKIENFQPVNSYWIVTSLGPAYGKDNYSDGVRFKLSSYVSTLELEGSADIAIRLHRANHGSVFELSNYEIFPSTQSVTGSREWTYLEITIPPITPAPDRVHLLLRQSGAGISWFDNVLLEIL
jgi:hypothetical protein